MKISRDFRNPLTCETTSLRYDAAKGMVSRPMRAGQDDIWGHAFIFGGSLADCRKVWSAQQDKLISEGFKVVSTRSS